MTTTAAQPRPSRARLVFALTTFVLAVAVLVVTFAMDVKWLRITVVLLMALSGLALAWTSRRGW